MHELFKNALITNQDFEGSLAFDFAIMVGGFVSADPDLAKLFRGKLSYDLPTVQIIGCSCGPHATQIKSIAISTAGPD
jgi:hypothetical protein